MVASLQPQTAHGAYETQLRKQLAALVADSPDWLQALRLRAMSCFEALGFPTRRNEAWKYVNLRPLLDTPFEAYTHPAETTEAPVDRRWLSTLEGQTEAANTPVCRLVFVNGRFCPSLSSVCPLPEGVLVDSLSNLEPGRVPDVHARLAEGLDGESDAFAALNTALFEDGALIVVPDNTRVEPLVQVLLVSTGAEQPRAANLRNLIRVGKSARLNLVIQALGATKNHYLNNTVHDFDLGEDAQVQCTLVQSESPTAWHLAATRATFAPKARLNVTTVSITGRVLRNSLRMLLKGEGAECRLNGLDVLKGQSEVYHHTVMEHWVPHCTSDQYYKGILDGQAKSEFNGLVFVAPGAIGTDSMQMNKNLVLSGDARVWTRPQLQINADDVKCAHGATVGQLEKDQLFYLASRGLDPDLAEAVLTYGFAEEIIQRVSHPMVRKALDARVLRNLYSRDSALVRQMNPESREAV